MTVDHEPNRLEVDLAAVAHNVGELRLHVGGDCRLYAALKCDAYGFGLVPVARTLEAAGVDALSVARMQDAVALRRGGVSLPILLYAGAVASPSLVEAVERHSITPTVLDLESARTFSRCAAAELPVFVKVDVGLRRLGLEPLDLRGYVEALLRLPRLRLDGVYTHMNVPADPVPAGYLEQQFELFRLCLDDVAAAGADVPVRMAASSSVLRLSDRMALNAIDPGRMYFGLVPPGPALAGVPLRSPLRALRTRLLQVKRLDDERISPHDPIPTRVGMRLGVVALGTADGLASASAGEVLVRGRRAPIVESISLEHCRIDLTDHPDAEVGDDVVVIGRQGEEAIDVDDVVRHRRLAMAAHVPIHIRESVPREYIGIPTDGSHDTDRTRT